jgi:sugar lactone lactonase YvrE
MCTHKEFFLMARKLFALLLLLIFILSGLPALAQDNAIATGLNNPRHISYGPDGTLYIAEAGTGGDEDAEGPYGPVTIGLTSQVTAVSPEGEQSVVVPELVSMDNGFGQIEGTTAAYATEDALWLVLGMGPHPAPEGKNVESIVTLDPASMEASQVIDLRAFEEANNPDEAAESVSNPIDLAVAPDGTLLLLDASANALLSWTEADGLKLVAVWQPEPDQAQAVPTGLEVDVDGNVYISFLSGYPFTPGSARIEVWTDGALAQTYEGLTLVTDLHVAEDGTIYAVQMAEGFGDQGYIAESGSVVTVSDEGITPVVEGLNYPYGIAESPDGTLVVTVNSAFSEPDSGMVIPLEM